MTALRDGRRPRGGAGDRIAEMRARAFLEKVDGSPTPCAGWLEARPGATHDHRRLQLKMKRASHTGVIAAIASAAVLLTAGQAAAATVERIASFGNNPTGIGMYLYTPSSAVSHPPILVGVHACHGKGTDVCASGTPFAAQADKYGFLLVCPSAVSSDGCWDVHSSAVLTHNGGGDASGIVSMVSYVVQNRNGDASRVFVAGHSSGGMMTNVLIGSYPDVFKAGAAYAGVPFACEGRRACRAGKIPFRAFLLHSLLEASSHLRNVTTQPCRIQTSSRRRHG